MDRLICVNYYLHKCRKNKFHTGGYFVILHQTIHLIFCISLKVLVNINSICDKRKHYSILQHYKNEIKRSGYVTLHFDRILTQS